ncbi:post-transcriptional regulator [Alicyclobacillus tolerans]|uniref:post-transcriptional regulator n=1 Tax=Alicyclobacillus tolerans TaxID=90970 RepID=UPI001F44D926|nr:post-transcriptional regulator [Alicyclobacillus tolerans]MCF8565192.1 post-transcriptional regulator [Alicyclobacillus tolerans]
MSEDTREHESANWHAYEKDLEQLCRVKAEEFHLLGYGEVTPDQVWACVRAMTKGTVPLHQWVANVLNLKVGQFMNYTTVNAYKGVFDGETP